MAWRERYNAGEARDATRMVHDLACTNCSQRAKTKVERSQMERIHQCLRRPTAANPSRTQSVTRNSRTGDRGRCFRRRQSGRANPDSSPLPPSRKLSAGHCRYLNGNRLRRPQPVSRVHVLEAEGAGLRDRDLCSPLGQDSHGGSDRGGKDSCGCVGASRGAERGPWEKTSS